jgi:hypothetical protein
MKNVSAFANSNRAATVRESVQSNGILGSGFLPSRDRKGVSPVEFYEQSR